MKDKDDLLGFLMDCGNPKMFCEKTFAKNFTDEYAVITDLTFPDGFSFQQKLYHYLNDDMGFKKGICPVCGNRCNFNGFKKGYRTTCSSKCSNSYDVKIRKQIDTFSSHSDEWKADVRKRKTETNIERYGGVGFASQGLKDKYEETMLETYGETHNSKVSEIVEHRKAVWMETYGCDNPMRNESVRKRSSESKRNKSDSEKMEIVRKIQSTKESVYGDRNYTNPQKRFDTNMERYGVGVASKSESVRNKLKANAISKSLEKHKDVISINDGVYLCRCPHKDCRFCSEKTFTINKSTYYERNLRNVELCTKLNNPMDNRVSEIEKCVGSYISSIYDGNIVYNDRSVLKGREIDVYLPDLKLGFEVNGDYWHCNPRLYDETYDDGAKRSKYEWTRMLKKEYDANANGVSLLHIWEYDYKYNKDYVESAIANAMSERPLSAYYKLKTFIDELRIAYDETELGLFCYENVIVKYIDCFYYNANTTENGSFVETDKRVIYVYDFEVNDASKFDVLKSLIRHALGKTQTRIFARKCDIVEIDNKTAKPFLNENSLFGYRSASITLGLYFEGELVMVYSFGNNYYGKKKYLEVIRVCARKNTVVVGGSTKCLSHFVRNHSDLLDGNELVFYVDKIHNDGNSMKEFAFVRHNDGVVNYWLDDYFSERLCGFRGQAFNRNPNRHHEIKSLVKMKHIVPVKTKGVDVYHYVHK